MFQHLLRDIRRQPVAPYAILAVIGIAGAASLAAARSRRDDGTLAHVSDALSRDTERLRSTSARLVDAGSERLHEALPAISSSRSSPFSGSRSRSGADVRQLADRTGISERALTTFMATVLATSAFSFLRWRSDKLARQQNEALARESDNDIPTQLHEHTVKELRGMAADQEIEGRSSMKKDELVDALSDSDSR